MARQDNFLLKTLDKTEARCGCRYEFVTAHGAHRPFYFHECVNCGAVWWADSHLSVVRTNRRTR